MLGSGSDKTVKVTLVAVATPYTRGMNDASTATRKLGADMDSAGGKSQAFGSKVGAAKVALTGLAVAGAAVAGTALVSFLSSAVVAAGDLEQSAGGVKAVFKESAGEVEAFGRNSAEAVGLSKNEFNQLVTVTGALLKNKGLEDFAGKSLDLVTVGADLAAQFGGPTSQAVEALNAAMRGESDPIERYGISLNETAVKAELAAQGLSGLTGEALEQAKAQARIDIVMRQSADAVGTFAREVDTLQGQQQRLSAEWEDAKAALGNSLLPAITAAVAGMREGVEVAIAIGGAFESVPKPVYAAAAALAAIHLLGGPLKAFGGTTRVAMRDVGEAVTYARLSAERAGGGFAGAKAGLSTFTGGATSAAGAAKGLRAAGSGLLGLVGGPWGLAITGAAVAVTKWAGSQAEAKKQTQELGDTLDRQTGAFTDNTKQLIAQRLEQDGQLAYYSSIGGNVSDLTDAILGDNDARARSVELLQSQTEWQDTISGGTQRQTAESEDLLGAVTGLNGQYNDSVNSLERVSAATGDTADATADNTAEQEKAELTAQELQQANDDLRASITGVGDALLGVRGSARSYESAIDDATRAAKDNGKTLDINTTKGRENQTALDAVAQATLDYAGAAFDAGSSTGELTAIMKDGRDSFIRTAREMGLTKDEARLLADNLGLIPDDVAINVGASGLSETRGEIDETVDYADDQEAYIALGANPEDARAEFARLLDDVNSATGTSDLDLDPRPGETVLYTLLRTANRSTGTPDLDAQPRLGYGKLDSLLRDMDRSTGTPDIDADDDKGQKRRRDFLADVNASVGTLDIKADTSKATERMRQWFLEQSRKTIGVTYKFGSSGSAAGSQRYNQLANINNENGGYTDSGARVPRQSMMGGPQYGKKNILWGEDVTGWEAYISGKPGQEARNLDILGIAAKKMGKRVVDFDEYANGGVRNLPTVLQVQAEMGGSVAAALKALGQSAMGGGGSYSDRGGDWQKIVAMLRGAGFSPRITSTYRGGARTATGYVSRHGLGKAVDMGNDRAMWDWLEARKSMFRELYGPYGRGWNRGQSRYDKPGGRLVQAIHRDHIHAAYADGGLVKARQIDAQDGEHVLSRRDVAAMGGPNGVYARRKAALDNSYHIGGQVGSSYGQRFSAMQGAPAGRAVTNVAAPQVTVLIDGKQMMGRVEVMVDGKLQAQSRSQVAAHGMVNA